MSKNTKKIELKDEFKLLDSMLVDLSKQSPLYRPGPYWEAKAKNAAKEIKKCGISDFRGTSNVIGMSYADNTCLDVRGLYNKDIFRKVCRWATTVYPISKVFQAQVSWTENYAAMSIQYAQEILNLNEKTKKLLEKYTIPYSILGNCQTKAKFGENEVSVHYLNLLEQHDNLANHVKFKGVRTIFEIGGGFGANVHMLLNNYPNIKKVIYLDIPPNLYVGTQYLKSFFGDAVYDYEKLKDKNEINFKNDDSLEIYCITPWQIEKLKCSIDLFMNSHSFVEMPIDIVKNYAEKVMSLPQSSDCAIALTSYDDFNDSTIAPDDLPSFFPNRKFTNFNEKTLMNSSRKNFYYVSQGKFGF